MESNKCIEKCVAMVWHKTKKAKGSAMKNLGMRTRVFENLFHFVEITACAELKRRCWIHRKPTWSTHIKLIQLVCTHSDWDFDFEFLNFKFILFNLQIKKRVCFE